MEIDPQSPCYTFGFIKLIDPVLSNARYVSGRIMEIDNFAIPVLPNARYVVYRIMGISIF